MIPLLLLVSFGRIWAAEICCPNLDCFSDTGAFAGLPLPECQGDQGITHTLYTRSNKFNGQSVTRTNIPNIWDGNKETVFVIHGWNADLNTQWMHAAKDNVLNADDKNVIIVGWGLGAGKAYYPQSASNIRVVGAETRDIKDILRNHHGSNIQTYCVGHSLGAHTCGHMGQFRSDRGVNRISGLDPAGPLFQSADLRRGLNSNCADQVEAWHTDGDNAASLGTLRPMGHRDFYPNGGRIQPGCSNLFDTDIPDDTAQGCSHGRATIYFSESAQNDCFVVRQICTNENNLPGSCSSCVNCPNMSYVNGSGPNGIYYLEVNANRPHCQS